MPALAIGSHLKKISPGPNGSEVGRPGGLFKAIGCPTLERIGPGEIFFKWLQIARVGTFYPKFFKNHRDGQFRKFSLALLHVRAIKIIPAHKIEFSEGVSIFIRERKIKILMAHIIRMVRHA